MWNSVRESMRVAGEDLDRFLRGDLNSAAGDRQEASKNAMTNVVTPNSIPKFTVPPLLNYPNSTAGVDHQHHNHDEFQQQQEYRFGVGVGGGGGGGGGQLDGFESTRSSRRNSFTKGDISA